MQERVEEAKEHLVANRDSAEYDAFLRGMIRAFREVMTVRVEDVLEEDEDAIQT